MKPDTESWDWKCGLWTGLCRAVQQLEAMFKEPGNHDMIKEAIARIDHIKEEEFDVRHMDSGTKASGN
jgi:hypothetical protein